MCSILLYCYLLSNMLLAGARVVAPSAPLLSRMLPLSWLWRCCPFCREQPLVIPANGELEALSLWAQGLHCGSEGLGTAQLLPPYSLVCQGAEKAIGDWQGCSGLDRVGRSRALAGRRKENQCVLPIHLSRQGGHPITSDTSASSIFCAEQCLYAHRMGPSVYLHIFRGSQEVPMEAEGFVLRARFLILSCSRSPHWQGR